MLDTFVSTVFLVLFAGFIGWEKYRKYQHARAFPEKQWEGKNPNERMKSVEELRLTQRRSV